ncbi:hypothetical protein EV426DRAFT_709487 [Tirmania nivea]|nr:hypothetical protein EV426DRAFT_709487 [Tirmania nivea]
MSYFIQPVALFSETTLTTLVLWDFDVDQIVGMPDNVPTAALPTGTSVSEPVKNPTVGDCIEVCGASDCDYLRAMPGLNKNGELSVSERVAKDILGDVNDADDFSIQKAAWGLAPQEKCEVSQTQKKLRKRQWYPDPYGQEYDYAPWADYYGPEQDPYLYESQYEELPLEFYEPKEYDLYHKGGQPKTQNLQNEYLQAVGNTPENTPQTQQSNRNVKISNDNSGGVNGKGKKNDERINSALTDPPRRNVGAPSPATKPNLNKGSTKRYPIGATKVKGRQPSSSESYSSDPIIAFHSAPTTDNVPTQSHVDAQSPEYAYDRAEAVPEAAPQAAQDPSAPRVQKIEHPDGSVEYSFGVVSGEVSVYNEGDAPKKPGRNKSVISSLKSQLGIDDEPPRDRTGWIRKSKRNVIPPEKKLSAKNIQEKIVGEDGTELKESVQSQRTPNQKTDFLRANGNRPTPKKQAPQPAPNNNKQGTPASPQPQPEQSEKEAEAAAQQEITDQQQAEFERLRRLSIKQFYRDLAAQGQDVDRDKEMEKKITEEASRVSAENAQKKREERARRLQGKGPKAEDSA